jgi:hypothetical protein
LTGTAIRLCAPGDYNFGAVTERRMTTEHPMSTTPESGPLGSQGRRTA